MDAGDLVKQVRRRKGLTQAQLARRCGTSQAAISRIERGLVSPTVETLRDLLLAMGEGLQLSSERFGHDRDLLAANLARTPAQRLANLTSTADFVRQTRRRNPHLAAAEQTRASRR